MSKVETIYIDHMGDAKRVVNAARVSFAGHNDKPLNAKDEKLIKYLADNEHMSPFEHCQLTALIKCPLYIRSQIHRHRTFAYNEISRRYTDKNIEFFKPEVLRLQSDSNKQASDGVVGNEANEALLTEIEMFHQQAFELYNDLISMGVAKEMARGVLPQNLMTEFYMSGNLRNWAHFVKLRDHEHAQWEVQEIARSVKAMLIEKFGIAAEVLF